MHVESFNYPITLYKKCEELTYLVKRHLQNVTNKSLGKSRFRILSLYVFVIQIFFSGIAI